jgi:hypothetical protein
VLAGKLASRRQFFILLIVLGSQRSQKYPGFANPPSRAPLLREGSAPLNDWLQIPEPPHSFSHSCILEKEMTNKELSGQAV